MMAIHHTLHLLTTTYRNEPVHIFTDCLNVLYLLITQIKTPTLHNNHLDKNILESTIRLLQSRTQITTLHKVKAHTNINGNAQADALAKMGCDLEQAHSCLHLHPHPETESALCPGCGMQMQGGLPLILHRGLHNFRSFPLK